MSNHDISLVCAWLDYVTVPGFDDDDKPTKVPVQCRQPAEIAGTLVLCERHRAVRQEGRDNDRGRLLLRYRAEYPDAPFLKGFTYVLRLSDGRVKIGKSDRVDTLKERFKRHHGRYGAFDILAVIDGGEDLEMMLHWIFRKLRIKELGEVFYSNGPLISLMLQGDIAPAALPAVQWYEGYALGQGFEVEVPALYAIPGLPASH
ncbi:hypothetical protein SUDANB148_02974 [Streptomyces sp. SudanB148_2056]|uniref:GIY-YIG nuclease family protein n=1 Tax=Streptomyces sp. SudanB148_2056 TaxID=3035280 RepID=UPI003F546A3F